jgi:hypothetical protein
MSITIVGPYRDNLGLRPVKIDKRGPAFTREDVTACCMRLILTESYFEQKAKTMMEDAEKAIEKTEKMTAGFSETLEKFLSMEKNVAEQSKRAAGSVRDAGEKLAQGLAKVEKAANFDRLERYVVLLERAAAAMTTLAELETSGKLEKIASAIR